MKETFAEDIEAEDLASTGVATNSSLNNLSYFHVMDNHTFDLI